MNAHRAAPLRLRGRNFARAARRTDPMRSNIHHVILLTMNREETIASIKETIVESLELEDIAPEDISTDDALFGDGLGLDSIDALELGMALRKKFGVTFSKDPATNKKVFASVAALADYITGEAK